MTLKIDLSGVKSLKRKVETMRKTSVEVGFFPEDVYGPENDNLPVAQVAWFQEKGAEDYPSRPFFSNTVDDKMVMLHLTRAFTTAAKAVLKDGRAIVVQLKRVGEVLKDELEVAIDDYPGQNSLSWAAAKGFNDPLRHTSKMLNSVKVKIKK